MRVALVHDWLTGMRGGERCLEVFCELYPDAEIFTLVHVRGSVSPAIERHAIHTSFVQRLPFAERAYRYYLPLFPLAVEAFDLAGHDVVLSSSHCVAKGVRVPPGTCHVAYIHTPARYVWDMHGDYVRRGRSGWLVRGGMRLVRARFQRWDAATAGRPYEMVANSRHVAERIRRHYGREARVVHPPVDFDAFSASRRDEGFYLMVTAFAPYKRVDLAIEAFNRMRLPLRIIGGGQEEERLRRLAGPTVTLLGRRSDAEVREAYAACRAVVFPGEEDFGIVPLEAMASGKPVVAYGKGGVLETVVPLNGSGGGAARRWPPGSPPTGLLFHEQTVEALVEAVRQLERHRARFDPGAVREHVRRFDRERFKAEIGRLVDGTYRRFRDARHAQAAQ